MSLTPEFYAALDEEAQRQREEQERINAELEKRRAPALAQMNALADDIQHQQQTNA